MPRSTPPPGIAADLPLPVVHEEAPISRLPGVEVDEDSSDQAWHLWRDSVIEAEQEAERAAVRATKALKAFNPTAPMGLRAMQRQTTRTIADRLREIEAEVRKPAASS